MDGDRFMEISEIQTKIRYLMDEVGWTEYKLSKISGISQSTITHLFNRHNAPTFATLEVICKTFGITLSQFFAEDGDAVVLSNDQRSLILQWGSLSDDQKDIIVRTMMHFNRE